METKNLDSWLHNFPTDPGTYAVILKSGSLREVSIGKLGLLTVQPGYYVYVGSAFGPGGLRARLRHHLRRSSKPHWHIDYLKEFLDIVEICFIPGMQRHEHRWAAILQWRTAAVMPFPRFGSSDCQCRTHLFFYETRPDLPGLLKSGGMKKQCESRVISEPISENQGGDQRFSHQPR